MPESVDVRGGAYYDSSDADARPKLIATTPGISAAQVAMECDLA